MDPLLAEQLRQDPRVIEGKKLIHQAIEDFQGKMKEVRPPNPQREKSYDQALDDFSQCRGGKLWFPYLGSGFGNGPLVELADGSVKYDFICGIGPHYFGHNHPDLLESNLSAALEDTVMQGHLQQNIISAEISHLLTEQSGMDHCFLSSTGVMANENALKLIFQNKHPAHRILAFEKCFMGRTLAVSQITDKPAFRHHLPANMMVDYLPFYDATRPDESIQESVRILQHHLARYPGEYAGMVFEMVQGEGGFYPGSHAFFTALMDVLKEHNVAILVDEVQTFGRTTELFAYHTFGLQDYVDVVTIGKLSQVCATLFKHEYKPGPGLLSQTFTSSTSALHAAKCMIKTLVNGNFFGKNGKIQNIHDYFVKQFQALEKRQPGFVSGPYGIGAMIAFTPFDGHNKTVLKVVHTLFEQGVIGFVAGANPMRIRFLVPMGAVTENDIDNVMDILEKTLLMVKQEEETLIAKE